MGCKKKKGGRVAGWVEEMPSGNGLMDVPRVAASAASSAPFAQPSVARPNRAGVTSEAGGVCVCARVCGRGGRGQEGERPERTEGTRPELTRVIYTRPGACLCACM